MTHQATLSNPLACAATPPPRHRWKVLAAGVAANAAFSVAFSGIPMTAVLMRSAYQLDNASLGLVLGLMGLGIAISELPWGLLTDRWGDRPVLLSGLASTALALAAMALWAAPAGGKIPSLGWLAGGLVLVGLLGGSVNGASGRAVMLWFADSERGLAMSIRQTAVPLGGGIGALVLPVLALQHGFAAIYALLASLCLLAALLGWAWVHEPPITALPTGPAPGSQPARGPLGDLRIWRCVAGIGILCAPQFAVLSFGTVFLHDFGQVALLTTTVALALVQVGAMVLRVWSGHWTDRRRNRPAYLRACSGLSMLLFAALALFSACSDAGAMQASALLRAALVGLLVLCGICVSAWHGVAYVQLASCAGAPRAGTALAMANTSVFSVCCLTPLVLPHLLAWQGWPLVWLVASACALLARPLLVGATSST